MSIERRFDIPLIASMALKEKQIQQNYRPIIAVHKWFARRPGTLFRGLLLAEFGNKRLDEEYFKGHDLAGKVVADPFMGGGTPLIEANRIGCDVKGFDINPMAAWIVREELEHLDVPAYLEAAGVVSAALEKEVGDLYRTDCPHYGDQDVPVKYFLWVKTLACEECGDNVDLFPGYLVADDTRHPKNVVACAHCGELNEISDLSAPASCSDCGHNITLEAPAKRGKCACGTCGHINKFPRTKEGPMGHRLFAIEYYNPNRGADHKGRLFKKPDVKDLARWARAQAAWDGTKSKYVPDDDIPSGDETDRLHRWGYNKYRDLFNARQLLGLELIAKKVSATKDERIRHALATNLSDLLRYQNMLCRYDTMALKSLDIFSVHGFPVGLVQCESNLLGIASAKGANVGSGAWTNIVDKYRKAKEYCDAPFEIQHVNSKKVRVPVEGEWIGEHRPGSRSRVVDVRCMSATDDTLAPESLDAVLTDPPYFGNVQYAELMDFCFVWLRKLIPNADGFAKTSTRALDELTVNVTEGRGAAHFTEGMARVYSNMARALKPGAPLAFTYHHNKLEAYLPIGVAILDSGLRCTASLPCPGEMGGSIHIHGTGSSIVDTVFVCRKNGEADRRLLFSTSEELARIVGSELGQLRIAGMKPSRGDIRCITFGHLTRMAIWNLAPSWNTAMDTAEKLERFENAVRALGPWETVADIIESTGRGAEPTQGLPLFTREDDQYAVAF
jgi:putative DNA methylase